MGAGLLSEQIVSGADAKDGLGIVPPCAATVLARLVNAESTINTAGTRPRGAMLWELALTATQGVCQWWDPSLEARRQLP